MYDTEMINAPGRLSELEKLVKSFEDCTLDPAKFHHRDHLAVALWYEHGNSGDLPSDGFRTSLLGFVQHHQLTHVYHETITLFWIKMVHHFYRTSGNQMELTELVERINEEYGNHRVIYDYYSKELLDSGEAKLRWVEPDLKPLY